MIWLLALSLSIQADEVSRHTLTVGCSDWKPYCYYDEGSLKGPAYQLAKKVMDSSKLEYSFEYFPWNRIYRLALNQENYLIMGLGRTQKRENLFSWIAPLRKPARIYAYKLKSSKVIIEKPEDLLNYQLAVERAAFTQDYLLALGYNKDKLITVSRMDQLLKMALHNRIDGFILDENVFKFESLKNNIDPNLFEASLVVFEVTEYLAAHKSTPAHIIKKIKDTYLYLLKEGEIELVQ